jgi:FKBP-type peptidyl-prolyl cis-trans isomerase
MKIKKLSLIMALCAISVFVAPSVFASGTNEVKASATLAMIQNIDVNSNIYIFQVLTENEELAVYIDKNDVDTIYNLDSYRIGDYVSFNNIDKNAELILSDNIRYITPYITSGAIFFIPAEAEIETPDDDYGFDNVLEHGFNYTYGYSLMQSFNEQGLFLNANYLTRGVLDVISLETEDFFTLAELQTFVEAYQETFQNAEIPKKMENGPESTLDQIKALGLPTILDNQFAYAYGYLIAAQFVTSGIPVDEYYFTTGILDAAYQRDSQMSQYQMESAMRDFEKDFTQKQEVAITALKEENSNQTQTFLAANATQKGVTSLESGIQYRVVTEGDGSGSPLAEEEVTINYELSLLNGNIIDSSFQRGTPATFKLTQVIAGFREAVMQMSVGQSIIAWIPPQLGYGEEGNQNIAPNSLLIFRIDLLSINK